MIYNFRFRYPHSIGNGQCQYSRHSRHALWALQQFQLGCCIQGLGNISSCHVKWKRGKFWFIYGRESVFCTKSNSQIIFRVKFLCCMHLQFFQFSLDNFFIFCKIYNQNIWMLKWKHATKKKICRTYCNTGKGSFFHELDQIKQNIKTILVFSK